MADEQREAPAEAAEAPKPAESDKPEKKGKGPELDGTKIAVKVYSAYQTFYDGEAKSISAENDTGPFDILPKHHNFITLVNPGEVIIRPLEGTEDKKLRISKGIMHVRHNKVTLFLDV
jgi:F0F1-type ATP synthase epsilon subunit